MKTIGIVGSRRRCDKIDLDKLKTSFNSIFEKGDRIVSGGCFKGGDKFAELLAEELGLSITIHHADWNNRGRAAGFIRNSKIAEDCDILLALVAKDRTGGTEDTVRKSEKLGKTVILI
jgi:hypothetical protein